MPNLAAILKSEVCRLARKEVREQTDGLRKTLAAQRSELTALKRKAAELEKALKSLSGTAKRSSGPFMPAPEADAPAGDASNLRFRPSGMASNRKRLGLSAADFGLLVNATAQSVYSWERGKAKPRGKSLAAIAALRGAGKKEVAARLEQLKRPA